MGPKVNISFSCCCRVTSCTVSLGVTNQKCYIGVRICQKVNYGIFIRCLVCEKVEPALHLVFDALVIISTLHICRHCKFHPIFSLRESRTRASPCFRRPCYHFYTSYLTSLQILRTMQNVFLNILNNFKHQNDKFSRISSIFLLQNVCIPPHSISDCRPWRAAIARRETGAGRGCH